MASPYYDDGTCTIYHGDCREVLPHLPRASVDLLLTDPPYGVSWQSSNRRTTLAKIAGDDGRFDVPSALGLALPVLRPHRHLYVFGSADLSELSLGPRVELIWDKDQIGPGDLALPWGPAHERIQFAVRVVGSKERENGLGRLAARLRRGSVLRVKRPNGQGVNDRNVRHPTEKPVDLLRQLIESSSIIGETVLDPFMGSGSTLAAAKLEGRKAIGIELEERYCEIAAKRLGQEVLDLSGVS